MCPEKGVHISSNGKQTRESKTSSLNRSVRNHQIRTKQKRAPQKDARLEN